MSVIRLPTVESGVVEGIKQKLSMHDGVSSIDYDLLRRVLTVEYNPDSITVEQIRGIIDYRSGRRASGPNG